MFTFTFCHLNCNLTAMSAMAVSKHGIYVENVGYGAFMWKMWVMVDKDRSKTAN